MSRVILRKNKFSVHANWRNLKVCTTVRQRWTPTFFLYYIGREQKIEGALPYISLKQFFDRIVK